jgi:Tfp pilus assembly protein PilV
VTHHGLLVAFSLFALVGTVSAECAWVGRAALFLGVLVLTGCMSTDPKQWSASGENTTPKRAIYECKQDAATESHRATAQGGAIMPIVGLFAMRSKLNECMESRGYQKVE